MRKVKKKPYFFRGIAYRRVGKSNLKLDAGEIEQIILRRHEAALSFDTLVCEGAQLADIDEEKVIAFLELSKKMRNSNYTFGNLMDSLLSLGLLKDQKITNSAVLFFGKEPQKFFPHCTVSCGIIKGNELISVKLIEGTLDKLIDGAFEFALNHMKKSFAISGTKRIEKYEYSPAAIREAITNSIIHRDHTIPSGTYLAFYEDRLEIRNPGVIPAGIKLTDLKKEGHPSIRRNNVLARLAYLAGYVEQWGSGTTKIVRLCREEGLKEPIFLEESDFFKLVLFNSSPSLSLRQKKAIEFLASGKVLSSSDYAKKFNLSDRYARKELSTLQDWGFIKNRREGKKIVYYIGTN